MANHLQNITNKLFGNTSVYEKGGQQSLLSRKIARNTLLTIVTSCGITKLYF